jgi:hypothetical protein
MGTVLVKHIVYAQAGLLEKALAELRNPKNSIDVNALDPSSGLSLLHLACAQGAMVSYTSPVSLNCLKNYLPPHRK